MQKALRIILPLLVLLAAAGLARWLVLSKPVAKPQQQEVRLPTVRSETVQLTAVQLFVKARGVTHPRMETTLAAEINAKVVWLSPQLELGSYVTKGTKLLELDSQDFDLAATRARGQLAEARSRLRFEQAQAEQARREWRQLGNTDPVPDLVGRGPQVAAAKAAMAAAEAALQETELATRRATVSAPFDAIVEARMVGSADYVRVSQPLAQLAAVDHMEVLLPLAQSELALLDLPLRPGGQAEQPIVVELSGEIGGVLHTWQGTVQRTAPAFDQATRALNIIVWVPEPLSQRWPMILPAGLFVEATIQGKQLPEAAIVPFSAIDDQGDQQFVWLLLEKDGKTTLQRRSVKLAQRQADSAVIVGGLAAGDELVISALDMAFDGMVVERLPDANRKTESTAAETGSQPETVTP